MASSTPNDDLPRTRALPPVQPPSGRFIIQLFVVPGAIIAAVVVVVIGLSYLGKRERQPDYFLELLDSDNADIRWRGASDLAQILKRPEPAAQRWKADAQFALQIARRLDTAYRKLLEEEQVIAAQIERSDDKDRQLLWRKLRPQRDYVSYLAAALGDFHVPVGAPILCAMLKNETSPDLKGNTLQRRKALWSLMNMGENLKGFARLSSEQQKQAIDHLRQEVGRTEWPSAWTETGLWYLDRSQPITGNVVKVDEALVACHRTDDRFLRELIAMSFNFWDGEAAEATLLALAADQGRGTLIRVEEND